MIDSINKAELEYLRRCQAQKESPSLYKYQQVLDQTKKLNKLNKIFQAQFLSPVRK